MMKEELMLKIAFQVQQTGMAANVRALPQVGHLMLVLPGASSRMMI